MRLVTLNVIINSKGRTIKKSVGGGEWGVGLFQLAGIVFRAHCPLPWFVLGEGYTSVAI